MSEKTGLALPRIALAQFNPLVGDVQGNTARIVELVARARGEMAADVVLFPELAVTGYPPEDLLLRRSLVRRVDEALRQVAAAAEGITVILGYPEMREAGCFNAAGVFRDGRLLASYHKQCLPNYQVFDERRYFEAGTAPCTFEVGGVLAAVNICEDVWQPGPATQAAAAGARILFNLNASPFHAGKQAERHAVVRARIAETGMAVVYLNMVGGQDELVFDGGSFVMDGGGALCFQAPLLEEGLYLFDPDRPAAPVALPPEDESVYRALVLGVRDYVCKNGFPGVLIGLSGGIDSALTLAVAVDALGAERVTAVMMPFRYTSDMSREDAAAEARALGVTYHVVPIEDMYAAFAAQLTPVIGAQPDGLTAQNLQARCRGVVLMALSNQSGDMVLTTGNKSEMAVGYATLYGDMAGGFDVLKDVPKTLVYRLARLRNESGAVIPARVIERPPSAELAPDQRDSDSLPDYDLLDAILERYIEQDESAEAIVAAGFDADTVYRVVRMVDRNEYKRRQAPVGVRISRRAFGRDRRYPITNGWQPGH